MSKSSNQLLEVMRNNIESAFFSGFNMMALKLYVKGKFNYNDFQDTLTNDNSFIDAAFAESFNFGLGSLRIIPHKLQAIIDTEKDPEIQQEFLKLRDDLNNKISQIESICLYEYRPNGSLTKEEVDKKNERKMKPIDRAEFITSNLVQYMAKSFCDHFKIEDPEIKKEITDIIKEKNLEQTFFLLNKATANTKLDEGILQKLQSSLLLPKESRKEALESSIKQTLEFYFDKFKSQEKNDFHQKLVEFSKKTGVQTEAIKQVKAKSSIGARIKSSTIIKAISDVGSAILAAGNQKAALTDKQIEGIEAGAEFAKEGGKKVKIVLKKAKKRIESSPTMQKASKRTSQIITSSNKKLSVAEEKLNNGLNSISKRVEVIGQSKPVKAIKARFSSLKSKVSLPHDSLGKLAKKVVKSVLKR